MLGDETSAGALHEMAARMITGSNVPSFGEIQRSRSTNYFGAIQQRRTENLGALGASLMSMIHETRSAEATDPRQRILEIDSLLSSAYLEISLPRTSNSYDRTTTKVLREQYVVTPLS
jgi:hypothetical protein